MPPKPIRMLGKTVVKRAAGVKPGVVASSAAAGTAGVVTAVITYRLLRSH